MTRPEDSAPGAAAASAPTDSPANVAGLVERISNEGSAPLYKETADALTALSADLAAAERRIGELREGLKPFAIFGEALTTIVSHDAALGMFCDGAMRFGPSGGANIGDLRRAASLLQEPDHHG